MSAFGSNCRSAAANRFGPGRASCEPVPPELTHELSHASLSP